MALFRPAEVTSAYLKMGLLGFAGSGKTKTASLTAIGLIEHLRRLNIEYGNRPVYFIDTETGSDWVKPDFDAAGVQLMVAKTRAFTDLLEAVTEAQKNGSILLVDSISHFWKELCDSYTRKKAARFNNPTYKLQFQDWGYLKGEWGKFTDAFVNSPLHIILAGRAGYEYDYFENDEGKKELEKTGVKMKAEGEMGYEPSLLVMMERHQKIEGNSVAETWREATILKDRSTLLDGKTFTNPKFTDFLPHIERLALGGKQLGVDTSRTSEHAIQDEKKDWRPVQRKIVLDELQTLMVDHYPSTTKEDKAAKIALLRKHFGSEEMTWTRVEELVPLLELKHAYDSMYRELKGKPSQYAGLFEAVNTTTEIDDEIPDFDKATTAPATPAAGVSIEEQLLTQIADLGSMADVLHIAGVIAGIELTPDSRGRINNALLVRQTELAKLSQPGNDGGQKEAGKEENTDGEGGPVAPEPGPTKARNRRASANALAAG